MIGRLVCTCRSLLTISQCTISQCNRHRAMFPEKRGLDVLKIGQIPKFGHVSSYMLEVLHWLPIRQRIEYRVASMVWRCQLGLAPTYLIDLCRPVSGSRSSRSLRSSERGLLSVPFAVPLSCRAGLVLLWPRRYGTASLLRYASYLGHFQTHSIVN